MQEKNRHILSKIIASLPDKATPAWIWPKIRQRLDEHEEQGREHLEKAAESIKHDYIKAPEIWNQLTKSLDQAGETVRPEAQELNRAALEKAIKTLPLQKAPGDLFENIVDPAILTTKKGKASSRIYRISGMAATVLLILTFGLWLRFQNQQDTGEIITYSEETIQPSESFGSIVSSFDQNDEVLDFVEANCLQIALKCDNDEFKGLLLQYKELTTAKETLMAEIALHQEQVRLIDYLIRVEKEKTEIGKKLIQYLLS